MIPTLKNIHYTAAVKVGHSLTASSEAVSTAPKGASATAEHVAAGFQMVLGVARAAQDRLIASIASVDALTAQFEKKIEVAEAEEKRADGACAAISTQLSAEVKGETDGAAVLLALIFPAGSVAITGVQGRSQVARYQPWLQVLTSEAAMSNPAYGAIASKVETFKGRLAKFDATIQEKEALSAALDAARDERKQALAGWVDAFRALVNDAARINGESSRAFQSWIQPIFDHKASKKGVQTRNANAKEAAAPPAPAPAEPPAEVDPAPEGDG